MSPELEKKLIEEFPNLFKGRHMPITENLMCFGCECEDGWYQLIHDFCEKAKNTDVYFTQIKEKFGRLVIYLSYATDELFDETCRIEDVSQTVCEICGKEGAMSVKSGWYKTLCAECREKENYVKCER